MNDVIKSPHKEPNTTLKRQQTQHIQREWDGMGWGGG